jgi:TetR/AcrR family transcriptional regulator, cholesterol catabolism regulator
MVDVTSSPQNDSVKRPRGRPRQTEPSPGYKARLDQIVQAAADVFHEVGYDAGSLEDVAASLDLRKASLYHYVGSKAKLLYLIFDRALHLALRRLDEVDSSYDDPAERLAVLIAHQVSIVAEERSMFAVFFGDRPRLDEQFEREIRSLERQYLRHYVDAVQAAMDAGAIPHGDPYYAAQGILGMSNWIYTWFDSETNDAAAIAEQFIRLILGPAATPALLSSKDLMRCLAAVGAGTSAA